MSEEVNGGNMEMSDADKAMLEQELGAELDWATKKPEEILVRGASLKCNCGTHARRMNLPKSYGAYVDPDNIHPFVSQKDCKFCEEESREGNITYFGICNSKNNDNPNKQDICLKPEDPNAKKNETGTKCTPIIVGQWLNPTDKTFVSEDGQNYLKIKRGSVLICKYGGVILVQKSGQESTEEE